MNQVQMMQSHRKVVSGRKLEGPIRSLVNARGLHEFGLRWQLKINSKCLLNDETKILI